MRGGLNPGNGKDDGGAGKLFKKVHLNRLVLLK
jgi:hypothetical protein